MFLYRVITTNITELSIPNIINPAFSIIDAHSPTIDDATELYKLLIINNVVVISID